MKKRHVIPALLLVALVTPIVLVATAPDLRHRVHVLWERQRLRSTNPATRKAKVAALLERKGDDLDELFPDLVAAAVMNVDSRTVFVANGATGDDRDTVGLQYEDHGHSYWRADLAVERRYGMVPTKIRVLDAFDRRRTRLFDLTYFEFHNNRALWVVKGDEVQMLVPLRAETGDRIVEAVEKRLLAGQ